MYLGHTQLTYVAYLDEFGHIGPYVARTDPKFKESPVFGLAGLVLPADQVRGFGTWFYQRKCELLDWEIKRAGAHPATWEKKGASLYTAHNVAEYAELRKFTNRFFNKIQTVGGFVFYVGIKKTQTPDRHNPNNLYVRVLLEAIKRVNSFCEVDCNPPSNFILALDEHDQRDNLITASSRSMYANKLPMRALIEPPFQLESHRYQTMQAADWIAGLVGRFGAIWCDPAAYPENVVFRTYFEARLKQSTRRSGIRS
ncbi:DUF3800 domain-containing protein [Ferranicluibacter rubi]|uniref:DUF3800 domain-containing protein n=1 Tax=Ferranicluibacter rubi TaxID=2715133 RepID=UPI0031BB1301